MKFMNNSDYIIQILFEEFVNVDLNYQFDFEERLKKNAKCNVNINYW